MGVDGWTYMLHDPVQVKQSDSIGRNVIDNFETAMARAKKKKGFVIAFSFTRNSHDEVARVKAEGLEIHLVSVHDLLTQTDQLYRIGLSPGFKAAIEAIPQFDASRHSVQELIESHRKVSNK